MKNIIYSVVSMFVSLVLIHNPAVAGVKVHGNFSMPASLNVNPSVELCENNPGPYITLGGDVTLGGLGGRLIFRNNMKGTHEHEEDVIVRVSLVPKGEQIRFNKQPSQGGVGGNPWIYAQFMRNPGSAFTDEILLGRCVQGLDPLALGFALPSSATVTIAGGSCSNHPGTNISVSGTLTLGGIDADLIFRNNEKGTHEHSEDTTIGIEILPKDGGISFAKSPHDGGAGGNPLVYFQFTDGDDAAIGSEILLGRCNKL